MNDSDDTTKSAKNAITYLQERGWMGEAGVALILGTIAGLLLSGSPMGQGEVWGMPLSFVYASAAATGSFLFMASMRLIPNREA